MSKAESEINSNDLSVGGERWRDGETEGVGGRKDVNPRLGIQNIL